MSYTLHTSTTSNITDAEVYGYFVRQRLKASRPPVEQSTDMCDLGEFDSVENATLILSPLFAEIDAIDRVFQYVCLALGFPGNILSAIVWLRLHAKNSSAVYLAALATVDLVCQLCDFAYDKIRSGTWFYYCVEYLYASAVYIEPLLVLGFSVERLLAICWPLRVSLCIVCLRRFAINAKTTYDNCKTSFDIVKHRILFYRSACELLP